MHMQRRASPKRDRTASPSKSAASMPSSTAPPSTTVFGLMLLLAAIRPDAITSGLNQERKFLSGSNLPQQGAEFDPRDPAGFSSSSSSSSSSAPRGTAGAEYLGHFLPRASTPSSDDQSGSDEAISLLEDERRKKAKKAAAAQRRYPNLWSLLMGGPAAPAESDSAPESFCSDSAVSSLSETPRSVVRIEHSTISGVLRGVDPSLVRKVPAWVKIPSARFVAVPTHIAPRKAAAVDATAARDTLNHRSTFAWRCGICRSERVNLGTQQPCAQCHAPFERAAIRVFVGQLRKDNTAEYLHWLLSSFAPDIVVHHIEAHTTRGEQRTRGAAFVHLDSQEDCAKLCALLNKRIFADVLPSDHGMEEGVWIVEDAADAAALADFARTRAMQQGRPSVLPRQLLVVEERGKPSESAQPYRGGAAAKPAVAAAAAVHPGADLYPAAWTPEWYAAQGYYYGYDSFGRLVCVPMQVAVDAYNREHIVKAVAPRGEESPVKGAPRSPGSQDSDSPRRYVRDPYHWSWNANFAPVPAVM